MKIAIGPLFLAILLFAGSVPISANEFDLNAVTGESRPNFRADGSGPSFNGWEPEPSPGAQSVSVADDIAEVADYCEVGGDYVPPCWAARAGVVLLDRDQGHNIQLMEEPSDRVPVSTSDLGFRVEDGFYFSLIGYGCLEYTYFGIEGWNAEHTYGPLLDGARVLVADPNPFNITGAIGPNSASYSSKLHSNEWNLRLTPLPAITCLMGFRYLELDERLELVQRFGGESQNSFTTTTQNRLYGFQIGADTVLLDRAPFRLEGLIKAGVYGNHARQNTLDVVDGDVFDKPVSGQADDVAFVGELGLTGVCDLTNSILLRAGYQLLWVEGVALAPNQVPVINFARGNGLDLNGSPFFHGVQLSVELRR